MSKPIKKKKQNREPSLKAKIAFKKIIENHGNVSKSMREAGFSPATAANPKNLTESAGFKVLLERYLPDGTLAAAHRELLDQKKIEYFVFPKKLPDTQIKKLVETSGFKVINIKSTMLGKMAFYSIPDARAKKDGLDMAYKIKGSYASEKLDVTTKGSIIYLPGKSKKDA